MNLETFLKKGFMNVSCSRNTFHEIALGMRENQRVQLDGNRKRKRKRAGRGLERLVEQIAAEQIKSTRGLNPGHLHTEDHAKDKQRKHTM